MLKQQGTKNKGTTMKAKIDLEKFISSMLGYAEDNCEETMLDYLHSALQDQGLEYKDGEIVEIEQKNPFNKERLMEVAKPETPEEKAEAEERENLRKRYERIGKSDWFKKTHEGIIITGEPIGTDTDGGVVGEKGEEGEPETLEEKVKHWQRLRDVAMEKIKGEFKEEDSLETKAIKEQIESLKKRIEDNQLGCIVQRLDKLIELLSWKPSPNITPYNPIIYKSPFYPDPNVLGGWTVTASTFGSDYDIDTNKIKQDETSKPES
jgi:hypothetical protein